MLTCVPQDLSPSSAATAKNILGALVFGVAGGEEATQGATRVVMTRRRRLAETAVEVSADFVNTVGEGISNLLAQNNCSELADVTGMVDTLMGAAISVALTGEVPTRLDTANLAAASSRVDPGQASSLTSGSASFTFSADALSSDDGASHFDVNLMDVAASLTSCFGVDATVEEAVEGVLGKVVSATVTGKQVHGLSDPIQFELPLAGAVEGQMPSCGWMDQVSQA
jgi:hypothetical protein